MAGQDVHRDRGSLSVTPGREEFFTVAIEGQDQMCFSLSCKTNYFQGMWWQMHT